MQFPTDYLARIAHGKNAEISAQDGVVTVPPLVIPAVEIPRPGGCKTTSDVSAADGVVINDSCVHTVYSFHENQAAQDDTAFYLLSGLWRVQIHFILHTDFAIASGNTIGNLDVMDQAGTRVNLISRYSDGAAVSYHEYFDFTFHIKPRPDLNVVQGDVWTFFLGVPATNAVATNTWQCQLGINFLRFL